MAPLAGSSISAAMASSDLRSRRVISPITPWSKPRYLSWTPTGGAITRSFNFSELSFASVAPITLVVDCPKPNFPSVEASSPLVDTNRWRNQPIFHV